MKCSLLLLGCKCIHSCRGAELIWQMQSKDELIGGLDMNGGMDVLNTYTATSGCIGYVHYWAGCIGMYITDDQEIFWENVFYFPCYSYISIYIELCELTCESASCACAFSHLFSGPSITCICYKTCTRLTQGVLPWGRGHCPSEAVNPHWQDGGCDVWSPRPSLPLISPPLSIVVPSQYLSMQSTGGRYNLSVEENLHVSRIFQAPILLFAAESDAACSCTPECMTHNGTVTARQRVK